MDEEGEPSKLAIELYSVFMSGLNGQECRKQLRYDESMGEAFERLAEYVDFLIKKEKHYKISFFPALKEEKK